MQAVERLWVDEQSAWTSVPPNSRYVSEDWVRVADDDDAHPAIRPYAPPAAGGG